MYINRKIESRLQEYILQFPVIAITGPRQSGKSTLVRQCLGEQYQYLSLDDLSLRDLAARDPRLFLKSYGSKLIIDEIQYVPELFSYIKMEVDQNRDQYGQYIFTGSQQFTMMKNISETLAGRIGLLNLLPLSLGEISDFSVKHTDDSIEYFSYCSLTGCYPELVTHPQKTPGIWYDSYIQTYLERDVKSIYDIGNLREFQTFLIFLAGRCAQVLNMSTLSRELGVAVNTIKKWISILEASKIISLLQPYYNNLGKRIKKNPKLYFLDNALVCRLVGIDNKEFLLKGPMAGALFENMVISEVLKTYFHKGQIPRIYFLTTNNNLEVDLLIESGDKLYPFEIKMSSTPKAGMAKGITRFYQVFEHLNAENGHVICSGPSGMPLAENVKSLGFVEFIHRLESGKLS